MYRFFYSGTCVRGVTFKKGLTKDEVLGFVRVVAGDWEHEGRGDDVLNKDMGPGF